MTDFIKPKRKNKKAKAESISIQRMMGVSADPCKYVPSDQLVTNTLVGIEIELEKVTSIDTNNNEFRKYWNVVEDGSLRDGGLEYVLTRPFAGEDLISALNIFDKVIAKSGKRIQLSSRTSIHVHIDVRELTYAQVMRFVSLYAVFEDALFKVAGEERKNGIYATSLSNAEGYLQVLGKEGDNPDKMMGVQNISYFSKYSACNLQAIRTYGSLEFRNHEGTYDIGRILRWVNILLSLRKEAVDNKSTLEDIFGDISNNGAEKVFKDVFGKYSDGMMYPDLEFDMFNGLRLAQDIIYSASLFEGIDLPKPDNLEDTPFTTFYKKRNKERYDGRIKKFLKSKGSIHSTLDYDFDAHSAAIASLRQTARHQENPAVEIRLDGIELQIDEDNQILEVTVD